MNNEAKIMDMFYRSETKPRIKGQRDRYVGSQGRANVPVPLTPAAPGPSTESL